MKPHRRWEPGFRTRNAQRLKLPHPDEPNINIQGVHPMPEAEVRMRNMVLDEACFWPNKKVFEVQMRDIENAFKFRHNSFRDPAADLIGKEMVMFMGQPMRLRDMYGNSPGKLMHTYQIETVPEIQITDPVQMTAMVKAKASFEFIRDIKFKKVHKWIRGNDMKQKAVEHWEDVPSANVRLNLQHHFPFIGDQIGSGAYGVVFACKGRPDLCIKIRLNAERGSVLRDGWLQWAKFCMDKEGMSPLLPKIHSIFVDEHIYLAVLERYPNESDQTKNGRVQYEIIAHALDGGMAKERYTAPERELHNQGIELWRMISERGLYCNDMHYGNVMIDSTGAPKIIDPMAGGEQYVNLAREMFGIKRPPTEGTQLMDIAL